MPRVQESIAALALTQPLSHPTMQLTPRGAPARAAPGPQAYLAAAIAVTAGPSLTPPQVVAAELRKCRRRHCCLRHCCRRSCCWLSYRHCCCCCCCCFSRCCCSCCCCYCCFSCCLWCCCCVVWRFAPNRWKWRSRRAHAWRLAQTTGQRGRRQRPLRACPQRQRRRRCRRHPGCCLRRRQTGRHAKLRSIRECHARWQATPHRIRSTAPLEPHALQHPPATWSRTCGRACTCRARESASCRNRCRHPHRCRGRYPRGGRWPRSVCAYGPRATAAAVACAARAPPPRCRTSPPQSLP
mmetsp:Transcript_30921/g.91979  ORF Transcript_30921/g.91979 Transcript_30921/m.91979 type:complete len:297 (-) Transcript_30921:963-1853(-)